MSVSSAKAKLLEVAENLKAENGFLLLDKMAKDELKEAVGELESAMSAYSSDTTVSLPTIHKLMGNWTLLVSTSVNRDGMDMASKLEVLPSYLSEPLKKIRSNILDASNRFLTVQQKIRSTNNDGIVDRIDIILELEPPELLGDVVMKQQDMIPEALRNVKLNPLAVSKSKLVLIHKAEILSQIPLRTKITLKSIVLNVAGTSRVLDPNGQDIAGINIPSFGEFLPNTNSDSGEFVTTFVDDDLRISRGKVAGNIEQLRVFCRSESPTTKVNIQEEVSMEEIVDIGPWTSPTVSPIENKDQGASSSSSEEGKGDDEADTATESSEKNS